MANETIGHVNCAHCGESADVRRYKTGARLLYYNCNDCGIIRPSKGKGQAWITAHVRWIGETEGASDEKTTPPAQPKAAEPAAAETETKRKKSGGLFGGFEL